MIIIWIPRVKHHYLITSKISISYLLAFLLLSHRHRKPRAFRSPRSTSEVGRDAVGRDAVRLPPAETHTHTHSDCFVGSAPKLEPATTSHPILLLIFPSRVEPHCTKLEPLQPSTSFPLLPISSFPLFRPTISPLFSTLFPLHSALSFPPSQVWLVGIYVRLFL